MYRIDSMYNPMIEALTKAVAAGQVERWMAATAWWLGRQQVCSEQEYWFQVAGKLTSMLPAVQRAAIVEQLGKAEDAYVDSPVAAWPAVPKPLDEYIAAWEPEAATVDLRAYTTAKRYAVETGGVVIDSVRVLTDRGSQAMINGAYAYVLANPSEIIAFKSAEGFVSLTANQVTAIANAVGAHVQTSFAAEAAVLAEIAAGTITTTTAIDAYAWPSNGTPA